MYYVESQPLFQRSMFPPSSGAGVDTYSVLVSCLAYSLTQRWGWHAPLKHSLTFYGLHCVIIPEDRTLHKCCCENFKSYISGKYIYISIKLIGYMSFVTYDTGTNCIHSQKSSNNVFNEFFFTYEYKTMMCCFNENECNKTSSYSWAIMITLVEYTESYQASLIFHILSGVICGFKNIHVRLPWSRGCRKHAPSWQIKVLLRECMHAEGLTLVVAVLEIMPSSWDLQHNGKIYHIMVLYKGANKGFISMSLKNRIKNEGSNDICHILPIYVGN